jgi:DNA-binding transcriptional ArsR family regulator
VSAGGPSSGAAAPGPTAASTGAPARSRRPATDAERRALASSLRLRILRLTSDQSLTNREIAARLGRHPATTLHHVRTLVDTGFLAAEPVRRGARGSREIPYRATRLSWWLSFDDDAGGQSRVMLETFLREAEAAGLDRLRASRLGLRLRPAELEEFENRLQELLDEYATRPATPDGEPWSLFVAVHPDVARGDGASDRSRDRP